MNAFERKYYTGNAPRISVPTANDYLNATLATFNQNTPQYIMSKTPTGEIVPVKNPSHTSSSNLSPKTTSPENVIKSATMYRDPKTGELVFLNSNNINDYMNYLSENGYDVKHIDKLYSPEGLINRSTKDYSTIENQIISEISQYANSPYWNSMSAWEKQATLHDYLSSSEIINWQNLWGALPGEDRYYDVQRLLNDLSEVDLKGYRPEVIDVQAPIADDYLVTDEDIVSLLGERPTLDNYVNVDDIYSQIDAELDPLYQKASRRLSSVYDRTSQTLADNISRLYAELAETKDLYNSQLNVANDMFNQASTNVRSQQHMANAQTYDALRSDLRRSRQNALESGASAGVRIAGNVNALLTAQNKQSATAMETSNALAEMLLQHRNATSNLMRDFANYKSSTNRAISDMDMKAADAYSSYMRGLIDLDASKRKERTDMFDTRYDTAFDNYNAQLGAWDNKYSRIMTNANNRYTSAKESAEANQYNENLKTKDWDTYFTNLEKTNRLASGARGFYST